MRKQFEIVARDVQVGDEIWSSPTKRTHFKEDGRWIRVVGVEVIGTDVRIETTAWYTTKHVREGIAVMRWDGPTPDQILDDLRQGEP
jgi:hypothetical protein